MAVCETDTAWWAIMLSYLMISGFTIGIGLRDKSWDTVSDMVARADMTLHGFAMVTILVIICQGYWLFSQIQRWTKRVKSWYEHPIPSALIGIGAVCSTVGAAGFGIVSTTVSEDQHLQFAAVSFVGVLLYLFGIGLLTVHLRSDDPSPHSPEQGACWWALAVLSLILLALDYPFWWEYVLITSLHLSALSFTIPMSHRLFFRI